MSQLHSQIEKSTSNYAILEQEQEDLLVCLADQDIKLKLYKSKLLELGDQDLSEDDEEESDE